MKSELENMLPNLLDKAIENLKNDGHVAPVFFSEIDGKMAIMLVQMANDHEKDAFEQFLLHNITNGKIKDFVFIFEAWVAEGDEGMAERNQYGSIAESPSKKEAVLLLYSSPEKEVVNIAKFDRKDEEILLNKWDTVVVPAHKLSPAQFGRFSGLFARGKAVCN